jgi:hypothetical protein
MKTLILVKRLRLFHVLVRLPCLLSTLPPHKQFPAAVIPPVFFAIAYVISRMDWYCALTEHLLNENNVAAGKDFQAVLHQLEKRIVELYKALLQY